MSTSAGGPSTLELLDADTYYGGVPTNFSVEQWETVNFKPLLGCMKDVQVDTTPIHLLAATSENHGVDLGCREKAAKVVTFKGAGYLELKSVPLRDEADFSFTFKTTQTDALLLVSTFQGQTRVPQRDSVSQTTGRRTVSPDTALRSSIAVQCLRLNAYANRCKPFRFGREIDLH